MLENEPTGVPGDEPEQTHDTQEAAATAATNDSGGEAAKRPRRRAASRPAGPPQPKTEEPGDSAPAEAAASPSAETETKPKRARKTAAKKVAAPEATSEDGESAPAAKKTTRTRTRKKAEAEQASGAAAEAAAESAASADADQAGGQAAVADRSAGANTDADRTGGRGTRGRTRGGAQATGAAGDLSAAASADADQTGGGASAAVETRSESETGGRAAAADADAGQTGGRAAARGRTRGGAQATGAAAEQPTDTESEAESAGDQPARRSRTRSRRTVEPAEAPESAETTGQHASAAETSRTALSSPFANPFAAPQLPAASAKSAKTEVAEAQQQPEAEAAPEAKPKTRTRRRAASAPAGPPRAPEQGTETGTEAAAAQAEPEEAVDLDSLSPADRARAVIAARAAAPAAGVLFQAPDLTTAAAQKATKATKAETEAEAEEEPEEEAEAAPTRRTRTRNRNRSRAEQAESAEPSVAAPDTEAEETEDEDEDDTTGSSSRRRRRRRRRAGTDAVEVSPDDPPNTVVKVRETRVRTRERKGGLVVDDDVQGVRGSTRLEAKKQRRREGRDTGRRRAPLITEAEFLARRESVERVMIVRQSGDRTQIGVLEDGVLVEHYVNRAQSASYVGNVYLGKVQNVLPSMEAAFVDIGKGRNAVLYAGEVNFDAAGITGQAKRIESVLKSGQAVLTQVTKDPIGHKGARLTSQISLPGRYLVYVPEGSMTGISRKLPENERNRLKTILKAVVPENAGVIVRTAAEGATEDELRRDVERLSAQWEEIQRRAQSSAGSAPTLLYGEPDLTVRVVRDIFNEDFSQLMVSGDQAWDTIREYVGGVAPDLAPRLERWTSEQDIFAVYRVDEQLAKALDRKVWLPSGGSLVIDRTEAMVVIDVNTGKFTGSGGNLEETVTRNNIEAAEEIVRQLRLRDLGGIIVIDFIDMVLESNRDLVMRRLLECLGRDRTKHQVAEVTSLGLVQMTRKRVGQGLLEAFSETCDKCNGRGVLVHMEPVPHSHGQQDDAQHERGGRGQGQQGRNARSANGAEARTEARTEVRTDTGHDEEHETGRGRRKRRKPHGHVDRQQHFDPQYDVDGVPEDFRDFADGEPAVAGPVTVSSRAGEAEAEADAEPTEVIAVSEHSHIDEVADHSHVVAPIVTPDDVVALEEADVTERLAHGDVQAHIVYAPHPNGDIGAGAADREETEAPEVQVPGPAEAEPALVAAASSEPAADAPKRRGLRVRRAAKRPAGPPTPHS